MKGTISSAALPMRLTPPKMISPSSVVSPMPVYSGLSGGKAL